MPFDTSTSSVHRSNQEQRIYCALKSGPAAISMLIPNLFPNFSIVNNAFFYTPKKGRHDSMTQGTKRKTIVHFLLCAFAPLREIILTRCPRFTKIVPRFSLRLCALARNLFLTRSQGSQRLFCILLCAFAPLREIFLTRCPKFTKIVLHFTLRLFALARNFFNTMPKVHKDCSAFFFAPLRPCEKFIFNTKPWFTKFVRLFSLRRFLSRKVYFRNTN